MAKNLYDLVSTILKNRELLEGQEIKPFDGNPFVSELSEAYRLLLRKLSSSTPEQLAEEFLEYERDRRTESLDAQKNMREELEERYQDRTNEEREKYDRLREKVTRLKDALKDLLEGV
jgi:septal ring factor EnvC (AmiA/AmiB activator)